MQFFSELWGENCKQLSGKLQSTIWLLALWWGLFWWTFEVHFWECYLDVQISCIEGRTKFNQILCVLVHLNGWKFLFYAFLFDFCSISQQTHQNYWKERHVASKLTSKICLASRILKICLFCHFSNHKKRSYTHNFVPEPFLQSINLNPLNNSRDRQLNLSCFKLISPKINNWKSREEKEK